MKQLAAVLILMLLVTQCGDKKKDSTRRETAGEKPSDPPSNGDGHREGENQGENTPNDTPGDGQAPSTPDTNSGGSLGCGATVNEKTFTYEVNIDNTKRVAYVALPSSYDTKKPYPVIFNFHGFGSDAKQQDTYFALTEKAAVAGFITVHPEGINKAWGAFTTPSPIVDDVAFFNKMLDDLSQKLCIQTKNVFSMGISNGGFMSYRLACEVSERLNAIAPIAGTIGIKECKPKNFVAVFHLHGSADTTVPYGGALGIPGAKEATTTFKDFNGCQKGPETSNNSPIENLPLKTNWQMEKWSQCKSDENVYLTTITGGGHIAPWAYDQNSKVNATDLILEFFTQNMK